MTSILPAVVTIVDLTPATSISSSTLFEAVQTTNGVAESVSVSLAQIISTTFGTLPVGGATGQLLAKTSGTNYDAQWIDVPVSAGTSLTATGSTSVVFGVTNFGISSAQIASFAITTPKIATNAVGSTQFRQSVALSVVGNSGTSIANVIDIAATTGGQVLQVNAGGTGIIWDAISSTVLPVAFGVPFTTNGIMYAGGATTISGSNFGTTGMFLRGNGSLSAPTFALVNLGAATNVTGTTAFANGGTGTSTLATPFGVVIGGTTALDVTAAGTSGFVLAGTGTTSAPTFQNITTLAVTRFTVAGGLTVSQGGTGGSITGTGTLYVQHTPTYKTATYTVAATDLGATIIFSTASLATAVLGTTNATGLGAGFFVDLYNAAATGIVISPLGGALITGIAATAIMPPGTGMRLVSDATNWVPQFAAGAYALHLTKTNQTFSGGVRLVAFNAGTTSGGTSINFDSGNGPIQFIRNAGTGTLNAPTIDGEIDVLIMGTTNASTLTFAGFNATSSAPVGDTYVANATSLFLASMRRVNGSATYRLAAYQ